MLQHPAKHRRIAVFRHRLETVREIAVVAVRPHRHPRGHRFVELRRIQAPLLARVTSEELLIKVPSHPRDHHILRRPNGIDRLRALLKEGFQFITRQRESIELVHRIQVDGNGEKLPADVGQNRCSYGRHSVNRLR